MFGNSTPEGQGNGRLQEVQYTQLPLSLETVRSGRRAWYVHALMKLSRPRRPPTPFTCIGTAGELY